MWLMLTKMSSSWNFFLLVSISLFNRTTVTRICLYGYMVKIAIRRRNRFSILGGKGRKPMCKRGNKQTNKKIPVKKEEIRDWFSNE